MSLPPFTLDKIRGLLIGLALGDAVGAMLDTYNANISQYTGYLQGNITKTIRGRGTYSLPAGTITDVTELALINARSMLANPSFPWQKSATITNYLNWSASSPLWMDTEMERYFKGIRRESAYYDRFNKDVGLIPTLSNTSMYRSVPLSLLKNNVYAYDDCQITHRSEIVHDANVLYVTSLRMAMWDVDINAILDLIKDKAQHASLFEAVNIGESDRLTDLSSFGRGDCFNVFYLMGLCRNTNSFEEAIDLVVTNFYKADIRALTGLVGAFFGAYYGYDSLNRETKTSYNINVIRSIHSTRPPTYTLHDFDTLCTTLHQYYA